MRYLVKIPFIRKNYENTKSAKYKGVLEIISNKNGIIYDWKINFHKICVDRFTTKRWFKDRPNNFKIREKLFEELNIKQEERPFKGSNKIKKLNESEIKKTNNFFNDKEKKFDNKKEYKITIKQIVGILKGNNPRGEAKNPSSAELILDSNLKFKNFVILIDDLMMKENDKTSFDVAILGSEEISLDKFITLNNQIESAFNFMQKEKNPKDFQDYLTNIKEYYKKYNQDVSRVENLIKKERTNFYNNIDKNINSFPFNFKNRDQFQKCHIYEVHKIKEKIIYCLRENKQIDKYLKMISDFENFIPLNGEDHRKFDSNYFTYKLDGSIWAINEEGFEYINKYMNSKHKKIDSFFLTEKRKKYLNKRNENIILE